MISDLLAPVEITDSFTLFLVAHHIITLLVGLLCASAIAYNLLTIVAGWSFAREWHPLLPIEQLPPISILKPLKGCDPQMYETFRSQCMQHYGTYEIVFGVNDARDEAIPYVEQLQREFPRLPIRLVVSERVLGENRKVSNLVQMLAAAKHDIAVVNDSDIRVGTTYLQEAVSTLVNGTEGKSGPDIGLVTCLYRGIPTRNLWSRIEALGGGW